VYQKNYPEARSRDDSTARPFAGAVRSTPTRFTKKSQKKPDKTKKEKTL